MDFPRQLPVVPSRTPPRGKLVCVALLLLLTSRGSPAFAAEADLGVVVPQGFTVELFADDELAHDIYAMTLDAQGRVVVSAPGYVRILLDKNGDGKADGYQQFADGPASGAQGMYFHGSDLLCTGDAGLIRYRDANKDDRADGPPELFIKLKTGGEHNAHAIRKGPDGWWYVIAGNTTEVTSSYITLPTSPVKHPEHGVILRLKSDLSGGEIFCHGFRNAYDFDFTALGELYSFDSDDERDVSLPWYRPSRVFHLLPAAHVGWLSKSWKRPDSFADMPPVLAAFGRSSPTGVACYRHTQFPQPYRGALFVQDWTFGRVWALPLAADGEIAKTEPIEFMTARGEFGFAPTDLEVAPDGSLYVSVGGRGTRGSVFRVRYTGDVAAAKAAAAKRKTDAGAEPAPDALTACLTAPQPLSSWSRARWEPAARQLGRPPFVDAALDEELSASSRVRAIDIITELFAGLPVEAAESLAKSQSRDVRARLAWSLERVPPTRLPAAVLSALIADPEPLVRRCALEAVAVRPELLAGSFPLNAFVKALGDRERFVRYAAVRGAAGLDQKSFDALGEAAGKVSWRSALTYGYAHRLRSETGVPTLDAYAVEMGRRILDGKHSSALKTDAVRLIQLGLGDLGSAGRLPPGFDGYASPLDLEKYERELDPLRVSVAERYPTGDATLDLELSRLAAMLTPYNPELLEKVLAQITAGSHPVDDIHHLLVAGCIPVPRSRAQQAQMAHALVELEPKIIARKLGQDTNWELRIADMYEQLVELDPDLPARLLEEPGFGRPGHVKYLSRLPSDLLPRAVETFAKAVTADAEYPWNNDVVFVFGLVEEAIRLDLVRAQYDRFSVRSAVLMTLAKRPAGEDRPKFVEGLDSSQLEVLTACIDALEKLPASTDENEITALVRTLRRLGTDEAEYPVRERVVTLLERATGEQFEFVTGEAGYRPQPAAVQAWTDWAVRAHPQQAAAILGGSESDLADLRKTLAAVDWEQGDAARGKKLFEARGCAQCHGGSRALGPDLAGVAGRFSREDLFAAIALPNRDVSPRYQTTIIESTGGKTYTGLIVYESVDGVLLRNSTNQTFRVESHEIEFRRRSTASLMPSGLLKDLKARDLADLYRFLQSQAPATAAAEKGTAAE